MAGRLIAGSDLSLKDEKDNSPPLGWVIHDWSNPPAGNHGRQREVVALLVAAGARLQPEWLGIQGGSRRSGDACCVAALEVVEQRSSR